MIIISFTSISVYNYYTPNIYSIDNKVTPSVCRTIKVASYHPLFEANSSPTYSLGCDPSRSLMKESSWLK
ncbi:hypothetical protein COF07_24390 [Bacillus wiedmannii]|nr:hypothetical protein COF07_24390 [Bacillus wiedmannii]